MGGYTNTALDDVLPVSTKLPQHKDTPSVAVALIIEDLATQSNVNISKVAGEGVIKLLTPADRVAVNDASGTDSPGGGWAVPMRDVVNEAAIDRAFDTMNPVDPVSYKPALTAAYNVLQHTNVRTSAEDSYAALGADYGTMQNIARWGGGRSYQAEATLCYRVGRPAWMASWQCRRGRQQQPLHRRC